VLVRALEGLADVIDLVERGPLRWNVRLHPYRIRADLGSAGLPTPEGLHRDGVDFVVTWMIRRHNVDGGTTVVTDVRRRPLWQRTLDAPMDLLIGDDNRTMHAVTPITPRDPHAPAFRDVLVVAFTKA
jgi:hypothetical protein